MENVAENSQIEEFIANLKGWKAYEEKKSVKLGFSNFEDYAADKILNDLSKSSDFCKAPKQQVRRKSKTKIKPVSTCGCCWFEKILSQQKIQS